MMVRKIIIFFAWLIAALATSLPAAKAEIVCSEKKWTETCFENAADGRRLKPQYLKRVKFQRNGFAVLYLDAVESVAINRKGRVVIPGIVSGEFDYTESEDGIALFYAKKPEKGDNNTARCGYFQLSNFKVVIPPVYNICERFYRQKAHVCVNCGLDCTDCQSYRYYGGEAFVINKKNEVLKRIVLPKIPRCSTVEQRGGFPPNQPCRSDNE